jgi:predicted nucleic acid-binding protein
VRLYLDTSALLKLYVAEDGSEVLREALAAATLVGTSVIAYLEARAALARRRRERDVSRAAQHRAVRELDADWNRYVVLEIHATLLRDAVRLSEAHGLRAYDALHLASARLMRHRLGDTVIFGCWDRQLVRAARAEGFRTLAPTPRRATRS